MESGERMELTTQTYEQWVAEGKPLVKRVKGDLLELCQFLHPKWQHFSRNQERTSNAVRSWTGFLGDIGMARSTAHYYLGKYDSKADKMLPSPERKAPTTSELWQADQSRKAAQKRRIEEAQARFKDNEEKPKADSFDAAEDALLQGALGELVEHTQKRQEFKERIKLSQAGGSDAFIDALMDYLDELKDDSRRIEACQNIIKVCRNVAAQLQRETE